MKNEWFYIQRWNKARRLREQEEKRKEQRDEKNQ